MGRGLWNISDSQATATETAGNIRARGTLTTQNGGTDATFLTATTRGRAHRGRNYLKKLDTGPTCAPPLEMSPRENGRLSGRCGHVASCRLLFEFLLGRKGSIFCFSKKRKNSCPMGVAGMSQAVACSLSFCLLATAHIFRFAEKHKNSVYWALRALDFVPGGV